MKKGISAALAAALIISAFVPLSAGATGGSYSSDRTAPTATSIHIQSNNANSSYAKVGDKVTLSFTTSEKVKTPIVLVESRVLVVVAKNTGGNSWEASYTTQSKDPQGKVDYLLTLVDTAGNVRICSSANLPFISSCPTTDGSFVKFDKTAPTIATPANVSAAATSPAGAVVTYALPAVSDNISTGLTATCTPVSGSQFPVGATLVTCSATDQAGNAATPKTFQVAVSPFTPPTDTVAPVISQPANITVDATSETGAVVTYTLPTATDNVDGSVAVTCAPASGANFPVGTTSVTCSASDSAGNAATPVTFTVTVNPYVPPVDTTAPVIAAHADVVSDAADFTGNNVSYSLPTATDNVDGSVTVTCSPASGSHFAVGTTAVTCNAQDAAGNNATPTTFNVTVSAYVSTDTTAPGVTATFPTPGSVDVPLDAVFTVTFNERVATTTVTGQGIQLWSGAIIQFEPEFLFIPAQIVPTTLTLNADGMTVTVTPQVALENDREYYFKVVGGPTAVADLAGNRPEDNQVDNESAFRTVVAP